MRRRHGGGPHRSQSTEQGHLTSFAQVVAAALDVDLDVVRVVQGDTAEVPARFGSRSMQVGVGALWHAAEDLVATARRRCAAQRSTEEEAVTYRAGVLEAPDAEPMTPAERAATGPLSAEHRFTPPQAPPHGAYAAVVEIDPDLGSVTVRQLVAVHDYGVVVDPRVVEGQNHGSVAQDLGQALTEEAVVTADGHPAACSLLDHLVLTAKDVPPVTLSETAVPNPNQPFGAKGAGAAGCIGVPPALVNAVCDAVCNPVCNPVCNALHVDHVDMPLTPEWVWRAMRRG